MSSQWKYPLLVAVVATFVLFSNLGGPRLWDRDEPRNAGCAAEMLARSDWVVPTFNDELRTHKPVLLYWLMMSAYAVMGVSEFSARFWSAALGVGTCLLTYGIGSRMFRPQVGLWAGLALASGLMFDVAGRAATPDSVLIFCCTLATWIYVRGTFPAVGSQLQDSASSEGLNCPVQIRVFPTWPVAMAMYAAMGLGVLAKGPIGLVIPTAVIGMYLLIQRLENPAQLASPWLTRLVRILQPFAPLHFLRTCWAMRPVTAIFTVLIIALPWYWLVGVRTDGDWIRGFFLEHNLGRATQAMEGHGGSVFFYPVAILIGFFPWSVFAIPTLLELLHRLRAGRHHSQGYIFAACWVGVYVGLFTIASTKLPSYVTPCYPALALLTGAYVERWSRSATQVSPHWLRTSLSIYALAGLALLIGIPIAATYLLPGEQWLGVLGLIPIVAAGYGLWSLRSQPQRTAIAFAASAVLLTSGIFALGSSAVDQHQQSHVLLERIDQLSPQPTIYTYQCLEPSWVFYAGMPIRQLTTTESSVVQTKSSFWKPNPKLAAEEFWHSESDRFLITTSRGLENLGPLPPHVGVLEEVPYFLKEEKLLLLGPISATTRADDDSRALNR